MVRVTTGVWIPLLILGMVVGFSVGVGAHIERMGEGGPDGEGWIDGTHNHCPEFTSFKTDVGQWLKDMETDPAWVWVDSTQPYRSAAGVAKKAEVTHTDFPINHDSHDFITFLEVDNQDRNLLSISNFPNEDEEIGKIDENDDPLQIFEEPTVIEPEWETGTAPDDTHTDPMVFFPKKYWPSKGDRVWVEGHFVFDCGHGVEVNTAGEFDPHYMRTEIHPPRAIASMRDQADTLPGTGSTPVAVTKTDLYIHGHGGFITDILFCGPTVMMEDEGCEPTDFPHTGTPIDTDFAFDVCLPPRPSSQAILAVEVDDTWGAEKWDDWDGTVITEDQVPISIELAEASLRCAHAAPGVSYDQSKMLRVEVPLDGEDISPEDVYAREFKAGWISAPDPPLEKFRIEATDMWLWADTDWAGDNCECTFFWANVNQAAGEEWIRLSMHADEDMHDFEANQVCWPESCYTKEEGHLGFEGAVFGPFHVRRSTSLWAQTGGWDQSCIEELFGHVPEDDHHLDPGRVGSCWTIDPPSTYGRGGNNRLPHEGIHLTERTPTRSTFELGGRDWGEGYHATSVAYGDIDGDGYDELAVTRKAGTNMRFLILEDGRGGNGYEVLYEGGSDWPGDHHATAVAFGDIDGDGYDEVGVTLSAPEGEPRFRLYDDTWEDYRRILPPEEGAIDLPELDGEPDQRAGRPWGDSVQGISIAFGNVDGDQEDEIAIARNARVNMRYLVLDDLNTGLAPLLPDDMYESEDKDEALAGRDWDDGDHHATSVAFGDVDDDGRDELGVARFAHDDVPRYHIFDDADASEPFGELHSCCKGWGATHATSITFGDVDDDDAEEFAVALKSDAWGYLIRDDGAEGDFELLHRPSGTVEDRDDTPDWADLDAISVAMGDLTGDGEDETAILLWHPGGKFHCENTAFWFDEDCLALLVVGDEGIDFRILAPGDLASHILGGEYFSPTWLGDWAMFGEPWNVNSYPQMVAIGDANRQDEEALAILCGIESHCNEATGNYRIAQVPDEDEIDDLAKVPRTGDSISDDYAVRFSWEALPQASEDDVTVGKAKSCQRQPGMENDSANLDRQVFKCWINATNEGPGIPRGVTVTDVLDPGTRIDGDLPPPTFNLSVGEDTREQAYAHSEEWYVEAGFSCKEYGQVERDWFRCHLDTIPLDGLGSIEYYARLYVPELIENGPMIEGRPAVGNTVTVCSPSLGGCQPPETFHFDVPEPGGAPERGFDLPLFETGLPVFPANRFPDGGGIAGGLGADGFSIQARRANGGPGEDIQSTIPNDGEQHELDLAGSGLYHLEVRPLTDGARPGSTTDLWLHVDRSRPATFDIGLAEARIDRTSGLPTLDQRSATVTWAQASDAGTGVTAYRYALDGDAPMQVPSTGERFLTGTLDGLTEGVHRLSVTAIDGAGNERTVPLDFCVKTRESTPCGKRGLLNRGITFDPGTEEHLMLEEIPALLEDELAERGTVGCNALGICALPRADSLLDGTIHVLVEGEKGTYTYALEMNAGTITGFRLLDDPSLSDSGSTDTRVTTTVRTIRDAMDSEEPRYAVMNSLAAGDIDINPDGLTESALVTAAGLASRAFDKFRGDPYELGPDESRSMKIKGQSGHLSRTAQGYNVFEPDDGSPMKVLDDRGTQVGVTTPGIQELTAEPMPGSDWSLSEDAGILDSDTLDRDREGWP